MKIIRIAFLMLIFSIISVYSQEIDADVTVSAELVEQEYRFHVSTMQSDIERYINSQNFTGGEWEGPAIPVKINIFLSGGYNGVFNARMMIASQRYLYGQGEAVSVTLTLAESNWTFEFTRGAMLSHNPNRFDRLSSMIDYYMYLIIGFDKDTYEELSGTPIYEKAKYVVQLAAGQNVDGFSLFYQPGEFTKYSLVAELTDLRYETLRRLFFEYYYDGLDLMAEDPEAAISNLEAIISDMAIFKEKKMVGPSALLQAWFQTKANEIAETFKGRMSEKLFGDLTYLDPTNTMIYQEAYEYKP